MESTVLDFGSNLAHTDFLRLVGILAPFFLKQLNHVLRESGADKNPFCEHFSSREAFKEIFKLSFGKEFERERVQDPEPNAFELLVCQRVMLQEASNFDIKVEVDSCVLIFIVDTKGADYPTKYVFKLITAEIREFQETIEGDLVLLLTIFHYVGELKDLKLVFLDLALGCEY